MTAGVVVKGDVLVVDDNPKHLDFLTKMLQNQQYHVRAVPDGARALRAARATRPDLVLLDVNMPELDGFEVCRRLKADATLADVPVIFLTAADEPLDKVMAFHLGAVDFITKPFQFPDVLGRVEVHLRQSRLVNELAAAQAEIERLRGLLGQRGKS